jgi:hypothetical protein
MAFGGSMFNGPNLLQTSWQSVLKWFDETSVLPHTDTKF